jgi:LPS export ABC transporter permease LptG/LPS export ABC transporter permease LptF
MLRIIDRYVAREVLVPFVLGLLVFTFILQIPPVIEVAEKLIAKGVDWRTIGRIMVTLLPQALGITIPMAVLVGLLVALGRLSGDREAVALQACGVSVYRLLVPVMLVAGLAWAATSWVMIEALPRANQTYREIVYNIVAARAENEVKPRVFFEDFPNLVIYIRDVPADGQGWGDVFLADTRKPNQPELFLAKRGRLVLDRAQRRVDLVLLDGTRHTAPAGQPDRYEVQRFETLTLSLDPDAVFPRSTLQPGSNELTIGELEERIAEAERLGQSPHNMVMALHRKFSIPAACLVFGLMGLGLGVSNRKDGRQSSFVVAIGVIFVYYVFMYGGEAMAKAKWVPGWLAMWLPNILLGLVGLALVWWRTRHAETGVALRIPLPFLRPAAVPGEAGASNRPVPAASSSTPAGPVRTRRADRVVLVVRWPQLSLPGARILDWYVAGRYARIFGMAFLGMLGIFYIASFIDLSDKLFKGQATGAMLLQYFFFATPQFIYYVLPIAALVATLVTVGLLTKSSELIVMRACGISLYRAAVPLLVFGALWSGGLFLLEETVLAAANQRARALDNAIRGRTPRTVNLLNRQWLAARDGSLYHYVYFDPQYAQLNGFSHFTFAPDSFTLSARTFTERADHASEGWRATRGWHREFDQSGRVSQYETFAARPLRLESLDYFMTERPDADRMSYGELRAFVGELRSSGYNAVPYAVELQRKLSFPFVTVIMTLIAVPFAVTTGSRGALFGVGVGIVLAIAYWLLFSVFAAIGTAGLITPVLAAWAPNILFAVGAAYLLLTVRT